MYIAQRSGRSYMSYIFELVGTTTYYFAIYNSGQFNYLSYLWVNR